MQAPSSLPVGGSYLKGGIEQLPAYYRRANVLEDLWYIVEEGLGDNKQPL